MTTVQFEQMRREINQYEWLVRFLAGVMVIISALLLSSFIFEVKANHDRINAAEYTCHASLVRTQRLNAYFADLAKRDSALADFSLPLPDCSKVD